MGVLGSAHPLRRPHADGKGDMIVLQTDAPELPLAGAWVNVMSISDDAPHERRLIASIRASTTPYFHSYGVTDNYAGMQP